MNSETEREFERELRQNEDGSFTDKGRSIHGVTEEREPTCKVTEITAGSGKEGEEGWEMDSPPENDFCSVCHDRFTLPCQANCSHWFCGSCILRVWHHGSALQPCKCPMCRRYITLLIPTESAQCQRHEPQSGQVLESIERYNRLFGGGSPTLMQRIQDLPFFIRRLFRELMDPQSLLPLVFRARMIFAMLLSGLYVLSPVDILPEGVLGLVGLLDDLLILLIVFLHLAAIYRSLLVYRHAGH